MKGYPFSIADIPDVCYNTTPNFVGNGLYCENVTIPKFNIMSQTKQTPLTCHAWCQNNSWCTTFFFNPSSKFCHIFSYGCKMVTNGSWDAYTRNGYTYPSYEPSTCTHRDEFGQIKVIEDFCKTFTNLIGCEAYRQCRWNCSDTPKWKNWLKRDC